MAEFIMVYPPDSPPAPRRADHRGVDTSGAPGGLPSRARKIPLRDHPVVARFASPRSLMLARACCPSVFTCVRLGVANFKRLSLTAGDSPNTLWRGDRRGQAVAHRDHRREALHSTRHSRLQGAGSEVELVACGCQRGAGQAGGRTTASPGRTKSTARCWMEELDAVSICTPNKFTLATIAALEAGCHVLCENRRRSVAGARWWRLRSGGRCSPWPALPLHHRGAGGQGPSRRRDRPRLCGPVTPSAGGIPGWGLQQGASGRGSSTSACTCWTLPLLIHPAGPGAGQDVPGDGTFPGVGAGPVGLENFKWKIWPWP